MKQLTLLSYLPGVFNRSIDPGTGGFTISSGSSARYFDTGGILKKNINNYGFALPDISQSIADNGDIWIADINSGLVKGTNMNEFSVLNLPGPVSNNSFHISSLNGKTIICGGGTDNSWNNLGRPFQVSLFEDNSWTNLTGSQHK